MLTIIVCVLCALVSTLLLTPFCRDFFSFLQIVDRPDGERHLHKHPVPRVGGIALAISYVFSLSALLVGLWRGFLNWNDPSIQLTTRLLPAVGLIFAIGLYDDLRGLSPRIKLVCEVAASIYASAIGVRLATPPGTSQEVVIVVWVMSIFWLTLCTNAINLIDGLDGLAAGVSLMAAASLLAAAALHHRPGLAIVMAPMVGCLIGFLWYNFNPATVFLGDCGSLTIGFLLGCYGLMWHQHATTGLGMAAPLVALALPVGEVAVSIMRRYLRKRPIFSPDRNHIHHRILGMGLSSRRTAIVLYGVSAAAAALALLQTILRPRMATVLLMLLVGVAYAGFRRLGYTEFTVLSQFLFAGDFRRMLKVKIQLTEYEQALSAATSVEECWIALRNTCREAEFTYFSLGVGGKFFEEPAIRGYVDRSACLRIMLSSSDFATFSHDSKVPELGMLIVPLVEKLRAKVALSAPAPAVRTAIAS